MTAYYNEFDKFAAAWLRALIDAGEIAPGDVDERSILEVTADDLKGYDQCHFFAGIGGWSEALHLVGWPDDRPVWTGSCPCQPLSSAGQQKGDADERHLWPAFFELIAERRPATIFGEQVANGLGREWFAGVRADLETVGYAVGAADLCSAGVGSPNIRQRIYWMADPQNADRRGELQTDGTECRRSGPARGCRVGDPKSQRRPGRANDSNQGRRECSSRSTSPDGGLAYADGVIVQEQPPTRHQPDNRENESPDFWGKFDLIDCTDGKARRVESGTFPLAHGIQARVGRLRGYGNAINPIVAAKFIEAFGETKDMIPATHSPADSPDHTALREAGKGQNGDHVAPENRNNAASDSAAELNS